MEVNKIDDDAGTLFLRLAQIFTAFIHYDISKPLSCQTNVITQQPSCRNLCRGVVKPKWAGSPRTPTARLAKCY